MQRGKVSPWNPLIWRSYRLKRAIRTHLGGEASALADGLGHLEWFTLETRYEFLKPFEAVAIIDAKSAYDHINKIGSPGALEDRRCAVELMIARQALQGFGGTLRWGPTSL
eukprot:7841386-Pyramimonas_sp.AAC.1